jgi:anti-anti-sigma regulatory factor
MNLDVKIENKGAYILAAISGDFDLNKALEMLIEILKYASDNNVAKILIDFRQMISRPSYVDEHTFEQSQESQIGIFR